MKRFFLLMVVCFFILFANYVNAKYDSSINKMVVDEKIEVEKNTQYYFACVSFYGCDDYLSILSDSNITKDPKLVVVTDNLSLTLSFERMDTDYGVIYYASFITLEDDYIYYMSYPINDYLYKYHDYFFYLVNDLDFSNYKSNEPVDDNLDCDGLFYVSTDDIKSTDEILSNIKAYDNSNEIIEIDIINNEYEGNTRCGNYYITLIAKDSSLNECEYRLLVKIVDITPPSISCPKRIEVEKGELLDFIDLLEFVTCDNISNVRIKSNDYYKNYDVDGEYEVIFSITDDKQNEATTKMIVGVGDKELDYSISKYDTDILKIDAIVDNFFIDKGIICDEYFIYYDNYSANSSKIGKYNISLSYFDDSWKNKLIEVSVVDEEEEIIKEDDKQSKTWIIFAIIGAIITFGLILLAIKLVKKRKR